MSRSHKKVSLNPLLSAFVSCPECDESITVTFYPGYPAPAASNHDDPRFSDPGGDAELDECPETCPTCGVALDENKMLALAMDAIDDQNDGDDYEEHDDCDEG